jgi:5-methyltetrahydrofolate--homocysteine methyltransferase
MLTIKERLKAGDILLSDGAVGSLLMQKGLEQRQCPESVNLKRPEILEEIAQLYFDAGADIIQTNTFGASPLKLAEYGLDDKTEEVNSVAVNMVKKVAGNRVYVSGSCGPSGKILTPFGDTEPELVYQGFERQIKSLVQAGVDILCIETMSDLNEAVLALKAARTVSEDVTVIATMTFEETPRGFYTIMGNTIKEAAQSLCENRADIIGSNCGNGLLKMIKIAREFNSITDLPLIIQSNAGIPVTKNGAMEYPESPVFFAENTPELIESGVSIIGGCCGTTPDTIRAIRKALNKWSLH